MKSLVKKIRDTRLFSDTHKVELLALLEEASGADKKKLETAIDAFDRAYEAAVQKHTAQIQSVLGHALKDMTPKERQMNQEALDELMLGLRLLSPVTH